MKFDFESVIERRGTYSIKHDPAARGLPDDVLPMWVADMDFKTAPCVTDALAMHVGHGIYGYSMPNSGYYETVQGWFVRRHNWRPEREWFVITPGVVNAIFVAIRATTVPGDGVLISQPVYPPFESAVRHLGRNLIVNELINDNGHYVVDYDDFEEKAKQAKLFVLCNPHNPVGRSWKVGELTRMGEICLRHGVLVVSDEIHQDFIYPGHRHTVFAGIEPELSEITITCTSPSKSFNIAGLMHANMFISNSELRGKFVREYYSCGLNQPGLMGIVSCRAAYENGGEWMDEIVSYLAGNMALIGEFLKEWVSKVKLVEPEGTYLAWLDCTELGLAQKELEELVMYKAKVWLESGTKFGVGGTGYLRLNAACPRAVLTEGLERLESALR